MLKSVCDIRGLVVWEPRADLVKSCRSEGFCLLHRPWAVVEVCLTLGLRGRGTWWQLHWRHWPVCLMELGPIPATQVGTWTLREEAGITCGIRFWPQEGSLLGSGAPFCRRVPGGLSP